MIYLLVLISLVLPSLILVSLVLVRFDISIRNKSF